MVCLSSESYDMIWAIIALFTMGGVASGFLLGLGFGLLRRDSAA